MMVLLSFITILLNIHWKLLCARYYLKSLIDLRGLQIAQQSNLAGQLWLYSSGMVLWTPNRMVASTLFSLATHLLKNLLSGVWSSEISVLESATNMSWASWQVGKLGSLGGNQDTPRQRVRRTMRSPASHPQTCGANTQNVS